MMIKQPLFYVFREFKYWNGISVNPFYCVVKADANNNKHVRGCKTYMLSPEEFEVTFEDRHCLPLTSAIRMGNLAILSSLEMSDRNMVLYNCCANKCYCYITVDYSNGSTMFRRVTVNKEGRSYFKFDDDKDKRYSSKAYYFCEANLDGGCACPTMLDNQRELLDNLKYLVEKAFVSEYSLRGWKSHL